MINRASSKLSKLRELMKQHAINAYIVPSADSHQSEYVAACDERRAFISGFTGSAGTALITLDDKAYLWTDGRYFLQAENELDSQFWQLMKSGQDVTMSAWLRSHYASSASASKIGVDPKLYSVTEFESLRNELKTEKLQQQQQQQQSQEASSSSNIELVPLPINLIDEVWGSERPGAPDGKIFVLPKEFTGLDTNQKLELIRQEMKKENCTHLVLTALDEIAWLLNMRGSDINFNPYFMSYVLLSMSQVHLYVNCEKFEHDTMVTEHLDQSNVIVRPYESFMDDLRNHHHQIDLAPASSDDKVEGRIWIDPLTCSMGVYELLPKSRVLTKTSPVKIAKSIKNETEIQGFKNAHVRDGAALVKFFAWLEDALNNDPTNTITECSAADKLEQFRKEQDHFVSLSFGTISGFGPNGAIIHYSPQRETCSTITTNGVYLLDSGAQYKDGTTDVTRTVHFGEPTSHEKECFTRVLKGHIALDTITFPEGTTGYKLDLVARMPLWQLGLDYNHGTGHGVGHFLGVHEGPQMIGTRSRSADEFALKPGMTITNEPGYYENGQFGIRIENIELVVEKKTMFNFGGKKYLGLESLTVCPIQTRLISATSLTQEEIDWVNAYNGMCYDKLRDLVRDDALASRWLLENTKPIAK